MTDRPIMFSGLMVLAILAGRKTQTRRLATSPLRKTQVGDRLWVRETWQTGMGPDGPMLSYRATPDYFAIDAWDGPDEGIGPSFNYDRCPGATWHTNLSDLIGGLDGSWRPSIHMPRWASRLTLGIIDVRFQRLHDITERDAQAEGEEPGRPFGTIWRALHGEDSWTANPEVVALTFRRIGP